jgi:chromosome segregation ATPase
MKRYLAIATVIAAVSWPAFADPIDDAIVLLQQQREVVATERANAMGDLAIKQGEIDELRVAVALARDALAETRSEADALKTELFDAQDELGEIVGLVAEQHAAIRKAAEEMEKAKATREQLEAAVRKLKQKHQRRNR